MEQSLTAVAETRIRASATDVWEALTDPALIKQYFFGTEVVSDWKEGSPIVWKGEWKGKAYEDKGTILKIEPERVMQYTHFSAMSGDADVPENYHTVTIELAEDGEETIVTLSQDGNKTEEAAAESKKNWGMMLEGLKKVVEKP